LAYASEHDIDLATAYSLLLGIISPAASPVPVPREQATVDEPTEVDLAQCAKPATEYDVGFIPAVADGHLTVRQAVERGDRVAFASRLAQRHGMSLDFAFQIADNRISLGEALRKHAAAGRSEVRRAEQHARASSRKIWLGSVGAVLLAAAAVLTWTGRGGGSEVVDPDVPAASRHVQAWKDLELQTDELGRIVSVSAPNPTAVLRGFCRPEPSQQLCEPVEIRARVSGAPGLRWGVFRANGTEHGLRAIEIRREGAVRTWTAGDGSGPIDEVAAPDSPPGTPTIPVSWGD
jgi:hypothetical protein